MPCEVETLHVEDMSNYWEEAKIQAMQAEQNATLGNYELAFAMYKSAIVSLLSGVQGAEYRSDDHISGIRFIIVRI